MKDSCIKEKNIGDEKKCISEFSSNFYKPDEMIVQLVYEALNDMEDEYTDDEEYFYVRRDEAKNE